MIEYHYQGQWLLEKQLAPLVGRGVGSIRYWASRNLRWRRTLPKQFQTSAQVRLRGDQWQR
jgi:hypothetical protein